MSRTRTCFCNECFYCFIQNDSGKNLDELSQPKLNINVAEYVGPETTILDKKDRKLKLNEIPIRLCNAVHNE